MAAATGFAPFIRSPSAQCFRPFTAMQFVHCQNFHPLPFQFSAGTAGLVADVQCAIQSGVPASAAAVELARFRFQNSGDV
jgi:hypothetical protein